MSGERKLTVIDGSGSDVRLPDLAQIVVDHLKPIVQKHGQPMYRSRDGLAFRLDLTEALRAIGGPQTPADAWALYQYLLAQSHRFVGAEDEARYAAGWVLEEIVCTADAECAADMLARVDWLAEDLEGNSFDEDRHGRCLRRLRCDIEHLVPEPGELEANVEDPSA